MQDAWSAVDDWLARQLAPHDAALERVLEANARAGLPAHDVSPLQGRFLQLLVRLTRATRVLEIGTLGGYSAICMAGALPAGGRLVTLEAQPRYAQVARVNLEHANLHNVVDLRVGLALELLPRLATEPCAPFDLVFIDADKRSNPDYLAWALELTRPGGLIVLDNVVRDGAVIATDGVDPSVVGVRRAIERIGQDPRLVATALQTVGAKGWDGLVLAWVVNAVVD